MLDKSDIEKFKKNFVESEAGIVKWLEKEIDRAVARDISNGENKTTIECGQKVSNMVQKSITELYKINFPRWKFYFNNSSEDNVGNKLIITDIV